MPILVTCPACGQSFSLRDELAGRSVRCRCGRPLAIPGAGAPNVLGSLLETELSRPAERPPERKAPVHRAEAPKSSAPPPPERPAAWRPPGEGIGLSIVKRLCELLEAGLEVSSEPGKGTTFQVSLPRRY